MTAGPDNQLSPRHRRWVYLSFALIFFSGAAWVIVHFAPPAAAAAFGARRTETWLLKIHGAGVIATLLVLGSLLPSHIALGLRSRNNRWRGIALLASAAFLILSGYALYYAADEELRTWTSDAHMIMGFAAVAAFIAHLSGARMARGPRTGAIE
jgi:cation transport ATPase